MKNLCDEIYSRIPAFRGNNGYVEWIYTNLCILDEEIGSEIFREICRRNNMITPKELRIIKNEAMENTKAEKKKQELEKQEKIEREFAQFLDGLEDKLVAAAKKEKDRVRVWECGFADIASGAYLTASKKRALPASQPDNVLLPNTISHRIFSYLLTCSLAPIIQYDYVREDDLDFVIVARWSED